jgi:hypothetical protein
MSEFLMFTAAVFGATAMLVGAKYGPPARLREWLRGRSSRRDWVVMWDCGMCVSFWVALLASPWAMAAAQDGWLWLAAFVAPGVFWIIEKLSGRGANG